MFKSNNVTLVKKTYYSGAVTGSLLRSKNQELVAAWHVRTYGKSVDYLPQDIVDLILLYFVHFDIIINKKKFLRIGRLSESKTMWINANFILKCTINPNREFSVLIMKCSKFVKTVGLHLYLHCSESAKDWNKKVSALNEEQTSQPPVITVKLLNVKESLNLIWNMRISAIYYKNKPLFINNTKDEYLLKLDNMEKLEWLTSAPSAKHYLFQDEDNEHYVESIIWSRNVFYIKLHESAEGSTFNFIIDVINKSTEYKYKKVFRFEIKEYTENMTVTIRFDYLDGIYYKITRLQKWIKARKRFDKAISIQSNVCPSIDEIKAMNMKRVGGIWIEAEQVKEAWKYYGTWFRVINSTQGSTISVHRDLPQQHAVSIFGKLLVEPDSFTQWDIDIQSHNGVIIGVINIENTDEYEKYSKKELASRIKLNNIKGDKYESNGIVWCHVKYRGYGHKFERGEKVSVMLDLDQYRLSFMVNDEIKDEMTFDNLKVGDYRLVATFVNKRKGQQIVITNTQTWEG